MIFRTVTCLAFVVASSLQTTSANDSLRLEVESAVRAYWDTPWREDLTGEEMYAEQVRLAQRLCDLGRERKQDQLVARGLARLALADTHWFWSRSREDGKWKKYLTEAETLCGTDNTVARAEVLGIRGHISGKLEYEPWGPLADLEEAIRLATRLRENELCCWLNICLARFHLDGREREIRSKYRRHLAVEAAHLSLEIAESSHFESDALLKEARKWVFQCRDPHFGGEVAANTPGERPAGVEPYLTRLLEMKVPPRLIGAMRLPNETNDSFKQRLGSIVEEHETANDTPGIHLRAMAHWNLGMLAMRAGRREEALSTCRKATADLRAATGKTAENRYLWTLAGLWDDDDPRRAFTIQENLVEALTQEPKRVSMKASPERIKKLTAERQVAQQQYSVLAASARQQWQDELARRKFVDDSIASERRNGQIQLWGAVSAAIAILGFLIWRYRQKSHSLRRLNEEMLARQHEQELREGLQEQVAAAQRLESIGTFSSGIAHDVNNALAVIRGFTEIAMLSEVVEERVASLRQVLDASDLAANTTRDLLLFARQAPSEVKPVGLGPLVQDAVSLMKRVTRASVNLSCNIADDSKLVCMADHTKLTQVLINLIQNSTDAIEGTGEVRVMLQADANRPAWARIIVEDTGRGISKEDLARVFEPFFTTKGRGKGTGLGMAVAHGIIEAHLGTIAIQSTESVGTTVTIELPLISDFEQAEDSQRHEPVIGNGRLVLVAEDDELVRDMIDSLLTAQGFRPIVCGDGDEFLEHYERHRGDVSAVILDCDLPGTIGEDCLKRIRLVETALPVLIISGWSRTVQGEHFLAKPFGAAKLNDALWTLLENDQALT